MVSLARKNLLHDKLRFVITVSGVAFAVTLVFVQVGLFMGLLDNATVTIEHARRRPLGHLAQHAERRLRAHVPRDDRAARARRARRRARRQPDRLVHEHPAADRRRGGQPGLRARGLQRLEPALERGRGRRRGPARAAASSCSTTRPSGASGAFAVGDYREILGRRLKIIGSTVGRGVVHHHADRLHGLRQRAGAAADARGTAPATSW